jgi:sensor histidine kinase YesM
MKVISAQIKPHFIFNSLALIRHLSVHDPEETPRAINEFSAFLRACTDLIDEDKPIPASKEYELVKHYVYMQRQRFGEDLVVEYDLNDQDFVIPAFAVQTTVENSITHGIRSKEDKEGSLITVKSYREDGENGDHIIEVTDNGIGFDTSLIDVDKEEDYTYYDGTGSHSGIQSTRERLRLMCGGTCHIESKIGEGTKVTIRIPDSKPGQNIE